MIRRMGSRGIIWVSLAVLVVGCQQAADEADNADLNRLRTVTLDVTGMT